MGPPSLPRQALPATPLGRRTLLGVVARWFLLLCLWGLVAGCALPTLDHRTHSTAISHEQASATRLGLAVEPQVTAHPGKSGVHSLQDPHEAFAARVFLAKTADRTLDVQYYIWRGDMTGTLLLEALHAAADRGVRVRLLLDDNGTTGLDEELSALDSHPYIEVRLFNPFVVRRPKWLGFVTDFSRANRRMHNKSFTADNLVTIVGGRNIGDAYFGAGDGLLFIDLDVFAIGPVVGCVSDDFDRYWVSQSSYPAARILPPVREDRLNQLAAKASRVERDPQAFNYVNAVRRASSVAGLMTGDLELSWSNVTMVSDDPAKGLGLAEPEDLLIRQLGEILGEPARDVELVSPYFVPTAAGVAAFSALSERGVRVRVLTNSLEATDVAAVHAGYAKRRKALLKSGVELYEIRRRTSEVERGKSAGPLGSSASSLHAKTFSVDRERVFVGSFNFDPRSSNLNTELGFIIDSPELAQQIDEVFDQKIQSHSYEVRLSEKGRLYWLEQQGDTQVRHDSEPRAGLWRRSGVFLLSLLPIEWLL
ncbi:phospholipase D family protein [Geoalkalibacter halelectricus]|uniref:phospholipase D family protein n=1 Tax=Geoalkalibacter halelectricus TaxID=2847045 RepID=UPI003460DD62